MKLVLKTITGKQHEVEVEPSATILDVKKLVEEEYEPASLRLCYNGAVLEDGKTVADAGVKEGESLVLAGRKRKIPKPAPQPPAVALKAEPATPAADVAPASSAPAMVNAEAIPSSLVEVTAPPNPTAATTATAATAEQTAVAQDPAASFLAPAAAPASAAPAAPVAPAAPEASTSATAGVAANLIDEVCSMGFEDRAQVALALRAAYMNVDRAVEYLFDGIPPHRIQELTRDNTAAPPAHPNAGAAPSAAPSATTAAAPAPSTPESELRTALAGIPQFDQIRALYAQNTETLPVVTQQIALRHPAVYEMIERDPEAFLAIMGESGNPGSTGGAPSTAHGTAPEAADGDGGFMDQISANVELSAEDRVAVQQLVELGGGMWDEQSALLVYFATQRNQEVAASILFEHGGVPPELLAEIANQMGEEGEYEDEDAQ